MNSELINKTIFGKYKVGKNLGKGSFGSVFKGKNIVTNEMVAIKVEDWKTGSKILESEAYFLFYLKNFGIPEIKSFGTFKKYKIVSCTPAIYSAGGVERVVTVKASHFAEHLGYEVSIIVTEGRARESYFPLSDKVEVINFELGFEDLWKASFLKKILIYLRKQRQFKQMLAAELMRIRPDFTISTLRREINFLNSIKDGSVKLGELHVNRANYRSMANANPLKKLFSFFWMKSLIGHLKNLEKMVVLTDSALGDWPELDNVIKIPDPLPFRIDVLSNLQKKRVVSIGRYEYDKGNDLLLQVWAKVEKLCPDWRLDVYGMGNRAPYELLKSQLGIDTDRCGLHGPVSDVQEEYRGSSVFVLPSRFEGFGLVLIEAMACGVPVISFDCENGPRTIISDGVDGFLIPAFDVDSYAEKLVKLMQNPSLCESMGKNARRSAEKYDIDGIASRWKELFAELKGR